MSKKTNKSTILMYTQSEKETVLILSYSDKKPPTPLILCKHIKKVVVKSFVKPSEKSALKMSILNKQHPLYHKDRNALIKNFYLQKPKKHSLV